LANSPVGKFGIVPNVDGDMSVHAKKATPTDLTAAALAALLAVQLRQLAVLEEIERGVTVCAQRLDGIRSELRREPA
jgi:hypothetical protein